MGSRRLAPNGELADLVEVGIEEAEGEGWNHYELEDGSTLKTKTILSHVLKAKDEDGETIYDEDGEPFYKVQFDSVIKLEEAGDSDDE